MSSSREDSSDGDGEKGANKPNASSSAQISSTLQLSVTDLQNIIHPDYVSGETADPLKAAERTGPRTYTIKNHNNENVRFLVFGCQGDKKIGQTKVAEHIKKLITEQPELKPDFIVLLGDNFYPNGVDSPEDRRFIEQFDELYDVRCFIVAGNHDFGYTNEEKINYSSTTPAGKARGMHQVVHSYIIHEGDPKLTMSKAEFWRQPELDLELLPRWNMPWLYYSVIIGNLQLFFIDSNHIADDYLSMYEKDNVDPEKNQAAWLAREFKACKEAGRTPLLFQHHPLVDISKRARYGDGDAHLYFKPTTERWKRLAKLFSLSEYDYKYDALLTKIYNALGIKFAANFAAHVHAVYNYVSSDICQFVVGSGGGKLQDRMCFHSHENIGFFLKELGFMAFSCNKKSPGVMNLKVFTLSGHELALSNARARPFTDFQDTDTADLYKLVLYACSQHASELATLLTQADEKSKPNIEFYPYRVAKMRNYAHEPTLSDVEGMHDIIAYFCQPELGGDFQMVLTRLDELMQKLTQRKDGSLYNKINQLLKYASIDPKGNIIINSEKQARFGKTVQELMDVNIAQPTLSIPGLDYSH